jgi:hypothetical protein
MHETSIILAGKDWKDFQSCLHIFSLLVSRDTFVPTKIVLKVGFLERDLERNHLAEKSYWTKMGQKIHCVMNGSFFVLFKTRIGELSN